LQPNLTIERPEEPPELVHFHNSAMLVFTEFACYLSWIKSTA
jgi:hypothetical protein